MKKAILVLMLLALLPLSGCISDTMPAPTALPPLNEPQVASREELYELYDQIDFNMTVAEIEAKIGPAVRSEKVTMEKSTGLTLNWERNGVYTQVATTDGQMVGKAVVCADPRMFAPLTAEANFDNVHKIERDMNYADIVGLMGCEGLEVMAMIDRSTSPVTLTRLMRWTNEDGSYMQILFGQDGTMSTESNAAYLFEAPTIEPGATYAPTATPDPSASPRPTAVVTPAPAETATEAPSAEPTVAVTEAPSAEPTVAVTEAPSAAPADTATEAPSAETADAATEAPAAN